MSEGRKLKNLFLTGMPGLGKSTFLIRNLTDVLPGSRGYRTVRVKNAEGRVIGFAHVAPSYGEEVDISLENLQGEMFLNVAEGRHFDREVFSAYVVNELEDAVEKKAPFILMDEIGGKELSDEYICSVYRNALDSPCPCIGIVKHGMNAKHFDYDSYLKFMEELENREDTAIVEFSRDQNEEALAALEKWLADNKIR